MTIVPVVLLTKIVFMLSSHMGGVSIISNGLPKKWETILAIFNCKVILRDVLMTRVCMIPTLFLSDYVSLLLLPCCFLTYVSSSGGST